MVDDVKVGAQSANRIVAIVAENPGVAGGIADTQVIPEARRDETYWMVLGNACLAAGQLREALEYWHNVPNPQVELVQAAGNCALHYCVDLYRRGEDAKIVEDADLLLANTGGAEEPFEP